MCFCRKILPNIWENHEFERIDKKMCWQENSPKYLGESSFWENLTKRCFCRKILPKIWENREFGRIDREMCLCRKILPNIWENFHHFSQIFGRIFIISPKNLGESSPFLPNIWENPMQLCCGCCCWDAALKDLNPLFKPLPFSPNHPKQILNSAFYSSFYRTF